MYTIRGDQYPRYQSALRREMNSRGELTSGRAISDTVTSADSLHSREIATERGLRGSRVTRIILSMRIIAEFTSKVVIRGTQKRFQ